MRTICILLAALGTAAVFGQTGGNAENGKRLFLRDGCWECHGYAGQGGRDGARIASTALNAQALIRYVRRPSGAMPAYIDKIISDQELTDIWSYLKTLPGPKAVKDIPLLNDIKNH
ncbi:MAG TPA: cytochrome c [Bryobacteraceae bacterium]|nr:cytochrome c [Bryobacteraceae bacterium]